MATISIPSKRIYLDTLSAEDVREIRKSLYVYNRAKEELYNRYYDKSFLGHEFNETQYIKKWLLDVFKMQPQEYHITSLESQAHAMVQSQKELIKLYEQDEEARERTRARKLQELNRQLTIFKEAKEDVVSRSKAKKAGTITELVIPLALKRMRAFKARFKTLKTEEEIYLYEVWLDRRISSLKSRIALIKEKNKQAEINRRNRTVTVTFHIIKKKQKNKEEESIVSKDENSSEQNSDVSDEASKESNDGVDKYVDKTFVLPRRATFGSRAFYKTKDTTDISPTEWHAIREQKRFSTMKFNGRFDSKSKNWLVDYSPSKQSMQISLITGHLLSLNGVVFPYRGADLEKVLAHKKEPGWSVGYTLELHVDTAGREFIIIRAAFDIHEDKNHVNYYTKSGVIGIDLNLDNISWAELDGEGHRIRGGMFKFSLYGKSTNQATDILGRVCSKVIQLCVDTNKPLVMEDINLQKKRASLAYGNKKANRGTSSFAYSKMTQLLLGKALQNRVGVFLINPAYTSFIGKVKYMKSLRCPIHMAAAYVIGRRGMGLLEKMPRIYRPLIPKKKKRAHHWKQFAHLYDLSKGIKTKTYRKNLHTFSCEEDYKSLAS